MIEFPAYVSQVRLSSIKSAAVTPTCSFDAVMEAARSAAEVDRGQHSAQLMACRVLRVNYAQPMKIKGGDKGFSHLPVWADADQYLEERLAEAELEAHARRTTKAAGQATDDTMAIDID
jgi:peptidyl-prolyl isomerase E (cyclophilin E)